MDILRKISSLNNFKPKGLIDVGANIGEFSINANRLLPSIKNFYLIEANEKCAKTLQKLPYKFSICLLTDEEKEIDFYINKEDLVATGNSYYIEETGIFDYENKVRLNGITLDSLLAESNVNFDFLKIDTQGSELDILKGSKNLLENINYILLECNASGVKPYNKGAPSENEIYNFLKEVGFIHKITLQDHFWLNKNDKSYKYKVPYGTIFQKDILYSKKPINKSFFTKILEFKSNIKKLFIFINSKFLKYRNN